MQFLFMEMQWINSGCIHSGEYFHGPFEVTDYDVPFMLVKSIGHTRHLDERVENFAKKFTEDLLVLDQKDLDLCTCYKDLPIKEFGQVKNKFFIRMQVANEPGVLAAIAEVFGDHKVSITRVVQEHSAPEAAELVIVTERVKECNMQEALKALMEIPSIQEISSIIREY